MAKILNPHWKAVSVSFGLALSFPYLYPSFILACMGGTPKVPRQVLRPHLPVWVYRLFSVRCIVADEWPEPYSDPCKKQEARRRKFVGLPIPPPWRVRKIVWRAFCRWAKRSAQNRPPSIPIALISYTTRKSLPTVESLHVALGSSRGWLWRSNPVPRWSRAASGMYWASCQSEWKRHRREQRGMWL